MKTFINIVAAVAVLITPCLGDNTPDNDAPQPLPLKNVELSEDGQLIGQYLTHTGLPVANAEIIVQNGSTTEKLVSDERGRFALNGARGGRCVIQAGKDVFACQLWAFGTAPPQSIQRVAVVASENSQVRGNMLWPPPYIPVPEKLAHLSRKQLVVCGLLVAGATAAIIIAADDDDDNAS